MTFSHISVSYRSHMFPGADPLLKTVLIIFLIYGLICGAIGAFLAECFGCYF